jgi:hypothetical protein
MSVRNTLCIIALAAAAGAMLMYVARNFEGAKGAVAILALVVGILCPTPQNDSERQGAGRTENDG